MPKSRLRGEAATIHRTLGRNVQELREAAGMSQERLAKLCGLSRSYLSLIEGARVNVTLGAVVRIARVFDVEAIDLLTTYNC